MSDVRVEASDREVVIKINGITHVRYDRRRLIGIHSWVLFDNPQNTYRIELKFETTDMVLEYDDPDRWREVLDGLDSIPIFNEWKDFE